MLWTRKRGTRGQMFSIIRENVLTKRNFSNRAELPLRRSPSLHLDSLNQPQTCRLSVSDARALHCPPTLTLHSNGNPFSPSTMHARPPTPHKAAPIKPPRALANDSAPKEEPPNSSFPAPSYSVNAVRTGSPAKTATWDATTPYSRKKRVTCAIIRIPNGIRRGNTSGLCSRGV